MGIGTCENSLLILFLKMAIKTMYIYVNKRLISPLNHASLK